MPPSLTSTKLSCSKNTSKAVLVGLSGKGVYTNAGYLNLHRDEQIIRGSLDRALLCPPKPQGVGGPFTIPRFLSTQKSPLHSFTKLEVVDYSLLPSILKV